MKRSSSAIMARAARLNIRKNYFWTKEEDLILTQIFNSGLDKCSALLINHSKKSIYDRIGYLGLRKKKKVFWSEEEIDILKNWFPKEGYKCSERLTNKSFNNIRVKIKILNLTNPKQWTEQEDAIIKKFYKQEGKKITVRLPGRNYGAIQTRASLLGIKCKLKKIQCVETKIIYNSISEANRQLGVKTIGDCLQGKQNIAGGYHWRYVDE